MWDDDVDLKADPDRYMWARECWALAGSSRVNVLGILGDASRGRPVQGTVHRSGPSGRLSVAVQGLGSTQAQARAAFGAPQHSCSCSYLCTKSSDHVQQGTVCAVLHSMHHSGDS